MKQKIKLFGSLFISLGILFGQVAYADLYSPSCNATINFSPSLNGDVINLKGSVTMTQLYSDGGCVPKGRSNNNNNGAREYVISVKFYAGNKPNYSNDIGSAISFTLDSTSNGKPLNFSKNISAASLAQNYGNSIPLQGCVFLYNSQPMTCSSSVQITLQNSQKSQTPSQPASTQTAGATNSSNQTTLNSNKTMSQNSSTHLYNPLPEDDLIHAFLLVLQGLLSILGILAVVFIVVGGVQMVLSAGNEEAIGKAKKTITWAIIGLVVAMLSFSIIAIVQEFLQVDIQTTGTPQGNPPANNPQGNPPSTNPQGNP